MLCFEVSLVIYIFSYLIFHVLKFFYFFLGQLEYFEVYFLPE
jgi:hypothetical protein